MKRYPHSFETPLSAGIVAGLVMALAAGAAPAKSPAPAKPEAPPHSVFNLPTNPREGRDPFFPTSNRPYESATAGKPHLADVSALVLRGISGSPDNRLAIINNHTFGVGDEGDLVTAQGRLHVRLVEVKSNSVVIEAGGSMHELKYSNP